MSRKILFVCLGNICRSPMAEGIFLHLCRERGLQDRYRADSAGTGDWHCGEPADARALAAAARRGVRLPSVCRQVKAADFAEFDLILPMDRDNRKALLGMCPPGLAGRIRLMREFDVPGTGEAEVPDPYFGGPEGFDAVFEMLHRCCGRLLDAFESGLLPAGGASEHPREWDDRAS